MGGLSGPETLSNFGEIRSRQATLMEKVKTELRNLKINTVMGRALDEPQPQHLEPRKRKNRLRNGRQEVNRTSLSSWASPERRGVTWARVTAGR